MKRILYIVSIIILCSFANFPSDRNIAKVNQVSGVYLFVDSEPVSEYEYLGSTKCKIAFSVQYQSVRDKLIKKVKKQYPKANGVIFHFHDGGTDLADAIYIK